MNSPKDKCPCGSMADPTCGLCEQCWIAKHTIQNFEPIPLSAIHRNDFSQASELLALRSEVKQLRKALNEAAAFLREGGSCDYAESLELLLDQTALAETKEKESESLDGSCPALPDDDVWREIEKADNERFGR